MQVGDLVFVKSKKGLAQTVIIRVTPTLVVTNNGTDPRTERRFKRKSGCECVPGGGVWPSTRLATSDGITLGNI